MLHNLGYFYQKNNEINKSIEFYTKAIQLNATSHKTLYNLGYIHQLLKLYNEAKSYFLKALEIDLSLRRTS